MNEKWNKAQEIMAGNLPGHNSIGGGHYKGSLENKTDFGGSGWKIRLDPKNDRDNYIIAHWIKSNLNSIHEYKLSHTAGDHPVWTLYTSTGSLEEAKALAMKAQKDIGKFLRLNKPFQGEDTLIPDTGISGRFEIRGDERSIRSKKYQEIVDEINRKRLSHNPYKGIYLRYKASPMFLPGFPSTTSGKDGVPGTGYYHWLTGNIFDMKRHKQDPESIKKFEKEAEAEIDLIKQVLKEKISFF